MYLYACFVLQTITEAISQWQTMFANQYCCQGWHHNENYQIYHKVILLFTENVLLVYTRVLWPREYERICFNGKRCSQIQDGCKYSQHKFEYVELTIPSSFYFVLSDIPMVSVNYALKIWFEKKLNNIKGSCNYLLSSLRVPLKPSTINR